jgi:hypothetical protein
MENLDDNSLNDGEEDVVDLQDEGETEMEEEDTDLGDETELDEGEEDQDAADPDKQPTQSKEENAIYAKMRRKAEEEATKKVSAELQKIETEKKEIAESNRKLKEAQREKELYSQITPEHINQVAEHYGVTEDYAKALIERDVKLKIYEQKEADMHRLLALEKQKSEFRSKPFFKELEKDIDNILRDNTGVDVQTAYFFLKGQKADELTSKSKSDTEKRTIANIQDRMKRRSDPTSTAQGVGTNTLSKTTQDINAFLGIDSREVAKHKKENANRFKIR